MLFKNKNKMKLIDVSHISKIDQHNMKRIFTRTFSTDDGKKVLAYLQYITFYRQLGAGVTNDDLRHAEGQRSIIATILRFVDQGREQ